MLRENHLNYDDRVGLNVFGNALGNYIVRGGSASQNGPTKAQQHFTEENLANWYYNQNVDTWAGANASGMTQGGGVGNARNAAMYSGDITGYDRFLNTGTSYSLPVDKPSYAAVAANSGVQSALAAYDAIRASGGNRNGFMSLSYDAAYDPIAQNINGSSAGNGWAVFGPEQSNILGPENANYELTDAQLMQRAFDLANSDMPMMDKFRTAFQCGDSLAMTLVAQNNKLDPTSVMVAHTLAYGWDDLSAEERSEYRRWIVTSFKHHDPATTAFFQGVVAAEHGDMVGRNREQYLDWMMTYSGENEIGVGQAKGAMIEAMTMMLGAKAVEEMAGLAKGTSLLSKTKNLSVKVWKTFTNRLRRWSSSGDEALSAEAQYEAIMSQNVDKAYDLAAAQKANGVFNVNSFQFADEFLLSKGINDPTIRQKILDAGLRVELLDTELTPTTLARFDKLFAQTIEKGKAFSGRLGNIDTRVATINKAAELERAGLTPAFEYPVNIGGGNKRFVDLVGLDANTQQPVQFFQFVKENSSGVVIRVDELLAAKQIENAFKLPSNTVQLINTNR